MHITGTNGKTSTSRMIESLLRATGLRTGLLTSPHLVALNERIMIDGEPITQRGARPQLGRHPPYLLIVDAELVADDEEPLTFFEALTVLAFASFADAPVDVVVLEVGMGGEWDSTNVADGQVAVFTPIALDHMARLGNTVAEIARTKAGIIKPAASVVTAMQSIEALDELKSAAAQFEARRTSRPRSLVGEVHQRRAADGAAADDHMDARDPYRPGGGDHVLHLHRLDESGAAHSGARARPRSRGSHGARASARRGRRGRRPSGVR